MPWYYAGPDATPVGPITLEELQARRAGGIVSPDTYIIEYVGSPNDARAWKRYNELFPALPNLPVPAPAVPLPPVTPPLPPVQAHPLFPSAASPHGGPVHYQSQTLQSNSWCNWGFGLGLTSLILLLLTCGLGTVLAFPLAIVAFVISCVGLAKVQHNHTQSGRNRAFGGLFLSVVTLVFAIIILAVAIPAILKGRGLITTTEQSTSDS